MEMLVSGYLPASTLRNHVSPVYLPIGFGIVPIFIPPILMSVCVLDSILIRFPPASVPHMN